MTWGESLSLAAMIWRLNVMDFIKPFPTGWAGWEMASVPLPRDESGWELDLWAQSLFTISVA
jgi:hypothetical protein